jgi:hypothetical protein
MNSLLFIVYLSVVAPPPNVLLSDPRRKQKLGRERDVGTATQHRAQK